MLEALAVCGGLAIALGIDRTRLSKRRLIVSDLALLLAFAVVARSSVTELLARLADPPLFDYGAFWISARAAAMHLNFYDPKVSAAMAAPLAVTPDFVREIVNVGFWYPPPSMFLFFPLGLLDYRPAMALLDAVTVVIVAVDAGLIARTFFGKRGWTGYVAAALLMFALHGAFETFRFGQWTFVALLFTLLYVRRDHGLRAGIWAVLAALTKPWLGVLVGASLLRRDLRAVLAAIVALGVLFAASAAAFHPSTIASFLRPQHYAALPPVVYFEPTNQSLHAFLLRHVTPSFVAPAFLCCAAAVLSVTAALIWTIDEQNRRMGYGLAMCSGLILYPVTQTVYDLLLVVPLLALWERAQGARSRWFVALLFACIALASRLPLYTLHPFVSEATFAAFVLTWSVLAACCARSTLRRSAASKRIGSRELSSAIA